MARQESLTATLKSEVDVLRATADQMLGLRCQAGDQVPSAPSVEVVGRDLSIHTTSDASSVVDSVNTGAYRGDVRASAIKELETGQIPTNSLGDGARMLGLPSYSPDGVGFMKRKRGSSAGDAAIGYAM